MQFQSFFYLVISCHCNWSFHRLSYKSTQRNLPSKIRLPSVYDNSRFVVQLFQSGWPPLKFLIKHTCPRSIQHQARHIKPNISFIMILKQNSIYLFVLFRQIPNVGGLLFKTITISFLWQIFYATISNPTAASLCKASPWPRLSSPHWSTSPTPSPITGNSPTCRAWGQGKTGKRREEATWSAASCNGSARRDSNSLQAARISVLSPIKPTLAPTRLSADHRSQSTTYSPLLFPEQLEPIRRCHGRPKLRLRLHTPATERSFLAVKREREREIVGRDVGSWRLC